MPYNSSGASYSEPSTGLDGGSRRRLFLLQSAVETWADRVRQAFFREKQDSLSRLWVEVDISMPSATEFPVKVN
jgi:hypothetical protein